MITASMKHCKDGMYKVIIIKDDHRIAKRKFADAGVASAYAMMYDRNYKRVK